ARLVLLRRRDVVFKEGDVPLISLFAACRRTDVPPSFALEPDGLPVRESPLVIRNRDGSTPFEYATIRMSFGFPPGQIRPSL
ncbi:MAG: hypothetical protein ABIT01_07335, partial [Thermoanaerobaculia bacterium]